MKPILLGTISGKLKKVPIINIPTGLGFLFIRNGIINKLLRKLVIKMMRLSSETWVLNKSDYNIIKKSSKKINISIMPGEGVDIEKFKEEHYMISEPIKLLMVARILKDKGVFEYIYAAKYISRKYTNVEFHYAGDIDVTGNPTAISKEMFNNLLKDSKIKYHGYINDIKHLLEKIDVLVLPSYREGLSMVLLEAASMKKILIASNVPGCKELVHNSGKYHNGFTCKPRSTSSLIRSIEKTISSKEKWNLMRCNSRMLVKDKYSSDIVIKYYKNKLKKYIGEQ
jgi:glycosyltransferase involved in cell wall biosynthesis